MQSLPIPAGQLSSKAVDISDDGQTIVGNTLDDHNAVTGAWRWTASGGLESLGSGLTVVAISGDGRFILCKGKNGASIWDSMHGARDLKRILTKDHRMDVSRWNFADPLDISQDGNVIAGYGWIVQLNGQLPYPPPFMALKTNPYRSYNVGSRLILSGTATNARIIECRINGRRQHKRIASRQAWKFVAPVKRGRNRVIVIASGPGGEKVFRFFVRGLHLSTRS
jgi:uncharacterized membrane protein